MAALLKKRFMMKIQLFITIAIFNNKLRLTNLSHNGNDNQKTAQMYDKLNPATALKLPVGINSVNLLQVVLNQTGTTCAEKGLK